MFYYYGRKKQVAKYYPVPNFSTIVEPFAGSAAYSLYGENWKKDVILVEKDRRVFDLGMCGDYLPFKPLLHLKGVAGKTSKEMIYYKSRKVQQLDLFTEF